jgi:hypothetical protein
MERRPQGSGSLTEVAPGRWVLRVTLGKDPVTGKQRRQVFRFEAKGKKAAEREADRLRVAASEKPAMGSKAPMSALFEEWLAHSEARGRAATTM